MKKGPETCAVIGAAMEVHRELGGGFLEAVYQDALAVELASLKILFDREKLLQVRYKRGVLPGFTGRILYALEPCWWSARRLARSAQLEIAQTLNYLKVTGLVRALIINFAPPSLEYKRLVLTSDKICANPVNLWFPDAQDE